MSTSAKPTWRKKAPRKMYRNDEIRLIILNYLYERNRNARSARSDKTGAAVKISVMRRDLKESHSLTQSEVRSNLTYLMSQGWVEEQAVVKTVSTPSGGLIPSTTSYYIITAAGIDKIEGPGEFTMDKFSGIRIEATGQNIITVGDGNQVNARFADAAQALADFKDEVRSSERMDDQMKVDLVADLDSIQSQLAKRNPANSVISSVWKNIQRMATLAGLTDRATSVAGKLAEFLT